MHGLLIWLFGFAAFMYLMVPIIVRFGQKMDPSTEFQPVDLATLPPPAAQYLWACQQALEAEGFQTISHLSWNSVPNVFPLLTLFMDRTRNIKAMSAAVYAIADGKPNLNSCYVEFITRYEDGRVLATNNNGTLSSFQASPYQDTLRLPTIEDPHRLLALHLRRMERLGSAQIEPLPSPGTELRFQQEKMREDYEEQAGFGRLQLNRSTGKYVPTWKGAYLMTWGLLWPVSAIRKARGRTQAAAALKALETAAPWQRV